MIEILVEWIGTILAVIGSLLIALRKDNINLIGFFIFMLSNIFYLIFSFIFNHYGLLTSQILFMVINVFGIINCIRELKND